MVRRLIRLVSVITNHQSRTPHLSLHYLTQTCVNPAVSIPSDIRTRRLFRIRLRMGSYLTVVLNTKGCNRFTLVIIPCCMPKVPARVILNILTVSRSVGCCDPTDHRRPPSLIKHHHPINGGGAHSGILPHSLSRFLKINLLLLNILGAK